MTTTKPNNDAGDFPQAPWYLRGQHWGGLFRTDRAVDASEIKALGAKPIFSHRLGVAVLRYQGELEYDELIVTIPVRIGLMPGVWIRNIWVSDKQSQLGGIQIWNLPKQLATFTWENGSVLISDYQGTVARLQLGSSQTHWPWAFTLIPTIGTLDGTVKRCWARWRGSVSPNAPRITTWSDRFEERILSTRPIGFSSRRLLMTVPAPSTGTRS